MHQNSPSHFKPHLFASHIVIYLFTDICEAYLRPDNTESVAKGVTYKHNGRLLFTQLTRVDETWPQQSERKHLDANNTSSKLPPPRF